MSGLVSEFFQGRKNPSTPIIALDIDGVLNCPHGSRLIDSNCAQNLFWLLNDTRGSLLISSSWRNMVYSGDMTLAGFEYALRMAGVDNARVAGVTEQDDESALATRLQQIRRWVAEHAPASPLVVLDDEQVGESTDRLVLVSPSSGLTNRNVMQAISLLRKQVRPAGSGV